MSAGTIRAAGGVVWQVREGQVEVAVVHRPRYDDWSLPKGKLEPGESELAAAVREVGEETGSTVTVSRRLTRIGYTVDGVAKTVAYWLMQHVGGSFVASDEVDEVRWLVPKAAAELLSHDIERDVLDEAASLPVPDSVVVLVRHAKAGKRSEWRGDDAQRPLDAAGVKQARRLADFLCLFGAARVVSATPLRCVQTVTPLARRLGVEVVLDPAFSDDDYVGDPDAAREALLALARPGHATVVSSQGATIPELIEWCAPWVEDSSTRKGAAWVVSFLDGAVIAADDYPDAGRA